jgi:beta-xylosidase
MAWRDDWPVIGADPDGDGRGEPVLTHRKPDVGKAPPIAVPATSDDFGGKAPGLQWQWNANPRPEWVSLSARPGFLRLHSVPVPAPQNLYDAPNLLLQKFPAPAFTVTTRLEFTPASEGEAAGLMIFGIDYAWIGVRQAANGPSLVLAVNRKAQNPGAREQVVTAMAEFPFDAPVYLRVSVDRTARCQFAFSCDNCEFTPIGGPFPAVGDRWVGAKVGLFASVPAAAAKSGCADFDWFYVQPRVGGRAR